MKRAASSLFLLFTLLAASGCATTRDHEALAARVDKAEKDAEQARADATQLRADLDATRSRLDNALRASADSSTDVMSSKARLNDLAGRMDETQHHIEELRRDLGATRTEIYARIDDIKRAQPAQAPVPQVAIPADRAAHFTQLRDAHAKSDWGLVRALGPEYVNRYPGDDRADEALFYVAEADRRDGRPSSALGHYNRLLKLFPRSKFLDRTLFGMGESYMLMHDCTNAKLAYEAVDKRFSKEKIGADARAKLQVIAQNAPGLCAPR